MAVYRITADSFVFGLTAGVGGLLVAIALGFAVGIYLIPVLTVRLTFAFAAALCLGIPLVAYLYSPREYALTDQDLIVRRPVGDLLIPLRSITSVRTTDKWLGFSVKTFPGGNSGLFGMYGTFYNSELGRFRMYAQRASNAVILDTADEPILVTPDERDAFVDDVEHRIGSSTGAQSGDLSR